MEASVRVYRDLDELWLQYSYHLPVPAGRGYGTLYRNVVSPGSTFGSARLELFGLITYKRDQGRRQGNRKVRS